MTTQLPLPRLTRTEAQARSALAQRARDCRFQWDGQEWTLSLQPLPDPGLALDPGDWRLRADWAGAPFELALPGAAAQAWLAARFPQLPLAQLPDELAAAALEAACAGALQALAGLNRGPAQLQALERSPAGGSEPPHVFLLEARCGEQVLRGRLATGSLGLMLMAGLVAQRPPLRNQLADEALPVLLRAEIGCTWLSASDLASLAPGDAVLIEHPFLGAEGELWLAHGDWGVRVRCEGSALHVIQPLSRQELPMSDTPAAGAAPALDQLPLRLAFDLGERTLSLAELKALQPGQTLELGRPLAGAVQLRVNGALVGTGELVEIDGRLGVTVTSLAAQGQ